MTTGRNDPCPCGSGKKYKRCCEGKGAARPTNSAQLLQAAIGLHNAGRLGEAEAIYRQVLQVEPQNADALHLLGLVAHQVGMNESAIEFVNRAIIANPSVPVFHKNAAAIHQTLGRHADAISAYRKLLALVPKNAEVHNSLGVLLHQIGQFDEAMSCYRNAVTHQPDYAEAHNNLGVLFGDLGRLEEAIACYRSAIAFRPGYADAYNNLGTALGAQGKLTDAIACYKNAIKIKPDYAEAHNNLGVLLLKRNELDDALLHFNSALAVNSGYAEAHNNLGTVFDKQGKFAEALDCFGKALQARPGYAEAHFNSGLALKNRGWLNESLEAFRQALELKPERADFHDGLLFAAQYHDGIEPHQLFEDHLRYSARFEDPLKASWFSHQNSPDKDRALKVGYVSGDFMRHAVSNFFEPLLARHDREGFEIYCYSNNFASDDVTERLKSMASHWREIWAMDDEAVAKLIREDEIDILVDLSGHTSLNRLAVFARKPAPVQASWLGYPGTTGLAAIDYRITDVHADPLGLSERYHSEALQRLDGVFGAYRPCGGNPQLREQLQVNPTPALKNGHITFGSLNNIAKLTPPTVELWSKILHAVPGSKLLIESPGLGQDSLRADFLARFAKHGVAEERLLLLERRPENQYFLYHRVDIALDPFPCAGGTTSCDALWMGVPLVTLEGNNFVSRMGVTWLMNLGRPEWIAKTPQEYIAKAAALAADAGKLNEIRRNLRAEVEASPLMDEVGFAKSLEAAYRQMWEKWCEKDRAQ